MSPEKDEEICKKYPKIFVDRNKTMQESPMYFGLAVSDGWYDLIDRLCLSIQSHIDDEIRCNGLSKTAAIKLQVVAEQVKSKFGFLRFYVSGGDDTTRGMISMAESMSGRICEECGNKGRACGVGWITTLCESCAGDKATKKASNK